MASGIGVMLGEITFVLFATLAPSGVVACASMGLLIVRGGDRDRRADAAGRPRAAASGGCAAACGYACSSLSARSMSRCCELTPVFW